MKILLAHTIEILSSIRHQIYLYLLSDVLGILPLIIFKLKLKIE